MPNNREREELHKAIWSIADDLRGSVDGWDFKQYILGIMFYRYISENITNYINDGERKAGDKEFDYAKISDQMAESERANLVKEKGFFILPSELFCNVCKNAKNEKAVFIDREGKPKNVKDNLNEYLEIIFNNIENSAKGAESEADFAGLFEDIDVNSNKLLGTTVAKRNDKLVKILEGIASIKLGNYKENTIDAFGDAYEFLMSMYASNAGKSGGEFYTPQEVSELLTKLAILGKKSVNKVYDPACGSGSLLLKASKILGKDNVRNGFFGQEINPTTYNLCRINMFLHDIGYDKFDIACEDTLISPQHWDDEPFEVIVSNPPYSIKWVGNDNAVLINDSRYSPAGVLAPKRFADFAFIMHSLSWLATNGTASIVCYPGIFYRGGAEQKIRKYLIDNNYVDCIIQLPENLFFGTNISTCIMVLKKNKRDNNTLFIDASKEYEKVTNNNKLTEKNIENILNTFKNRKNIKHIAKLARNSEIAEKNYNLSVATYVQKEGQTEEINIDKLNELIDKIVEKEQIIREEIKKIIVEYESYKNNKTTKDIEWIELGKYCKRLKGTSITAGKMKQIAEEDGNIKIFAGGKTVIDTNEKNIPQKDIINVPNIIVQSRGIIDFIYYNKPCSFKKEMWSYTCDNEITLKYIYYYLKRNVEYFRQRGSQMGSMPQISLDVTEKYRIPLPKIEEQRKIVSILEKFDKITNDFSEGLPAEIEARQKQYEYYRNRLLTFEGNNDE